MLYGHVQIDFVVHDIRDSKIDKQILHNIL